MNVKNPQILIRRALPNDARKISYLIHKTTEANPNHYNEEQIWAWKRYNTTAKVRKQIEERYVFCALRDQKLVGTIALAESQVVGLYVSNQHSGKGIGKKLLSHLEAFALSLHLNELELDATPSGRPFYERMGYKAIENITVVILGVEYEETRMLKELLPIRL